MSNGTIGSKRSSKRGICLDTTARSSWTPCRIYQQREIDDLTLGTPSQLWTVPTVLTSIGEEEPNAVPGVDSDPDDAQPWGANPT